MDSVCEASALFMQPRVLRENGTAIKLARKEAGELEFSHRRTPHIFFVCPPLEHSLHF